MKLLIESSTQAEKFSSILDMLYDNGVDTDDIDEILSSYDPDGKIPFTDAVFDMCGPEDQQLLMSLVMQKQKELLQPGNAGYCKYLYDIAWNNSYDDYYKGVIDFVEAALAENILDLN